MRFSVRHLIVLLMARVIKQNSTSRDDFDVVYVKRIMAHWSRADVVDRVRRVVSLRGIQIAHRAAAA